ncbi:MAG: cupin domain-containing protein [Nannocystaceae bacterium]
MDKTPPMVVNLDEVPPTERLLGERWGARYRPMTPSMRARGGTLGVNWICLPPGRACVPFHAHQREDEVFWILSGAGILRYGDEVQRIRAGDCIACPAGTGVAHQIANDSDADLVYLAIGGYDRDEVCIYPESGKVLIRSLQQVGRIMASEYMDGEPEVPGAFTIGAPRFAGDET